MILDHTVNAHLYTCLGPLFKKAFAHLSATDFMKLELGKHVIQDEDLFVIVMEYESKALEECVMENHRKYIDIQYIISGEELMGITTFAGQIPTTPYDETKDAAFYKKEYSSLIKVQAGQFTIFFPHDLHMPSLKTDRQTLVRKAVYKLKVQ
jgi:YhcH/YjgK/YiaL family protein